jgi:hypothetical protein
MGWLVVEITRQPAVKCDQVHHKDAQVVDLFDAKETCR